MERRRQRLAQLCEAGFDYDPRWLSYLETVADVTASQRKGYLDECLAEKSWNGSWTVVARNAR
jgi:hypothetical protein